MIGESMAAMVSEWSDGELIRRFDTTNFDEVKTRCASELSKRFADGFLVYDTCRQRYVESIDTHDGDTEWTSDKRTARIFSGQTWVEVWARQGIRFERPDRQGT